MNRRKLKLLLAIPYTLIALGALGLWIYDKRRDAPADGPPAAIPYPPIEERALRQKLRWVLHTPAPSSEVVVVSFGWRAEKIYGPPPWPRDVYAAVLAKLRAAGVRSIVLDPLFADAQLRHLAPAAYRALFPALKLEQLTVVNPFNYVGELEKKLVREERRLRREGLQDEKAAAHFQAFVTQRKQLMTLVRGIARGDASRAFEREVARRKDIVFVTDYSNRPTFTKSKARALALLAKQALPSFSGAERIKGFKYLLTLYPRLLADAPLVGVNDVERRQQRFIARARLLVRHGERVYPSSILRGVAHQLGVPLRAPVPRAEGGFTLALGARRLQIDADGSFPLLYYTQPFPRSYSAIQLLRGKVPKAALAGKLAIVDIRTKQTEAYLRLPTPLFQQAWVSEIKATLASNLLAGHRGPTISEDPWWLDTLEVGAMVGLALLFMLAAFRVSPLWALGGGLTLIGLVAGADLLLFARGHLWFRVVVLLIELGLLLIVNFAGHYLLQRGERQKVRRAFGFYLPESVLEHMLADDDALKLGGARRNLSMLFSDIRGFTSLSERADPEALGEALNVHLTALTEEVFARDGTLDKYMGDCVMAFFGSPVPHEDHALRAVRSALGMQERLRSIQHVWRERCGSEISIGVGVATGDVIVGNMGSVKLFDYTVIGDHVNLASRLEGLTKVYGVEVLVAEETHRQTGDAIHYLEVDKVRVKGKREPVAIFEAVCEGRPTTERQAYDAACTRGIAAYRAQEWDAADAAFGQAAQHMPDARLPALYRERIATLRAETLPADWDGVMEFTHK